MLDQLTNIDFHILDFWQNHLTHPLLDKFMVFFTTLGNSGALWIVLGVVLLFFKTWRETGIKLLLALLLGHVVFTLGLKEIVMRARPFQQDLSIELLIGAPKEFSFPSGHTVSSLAAATVLILQKFPLRFLALAFALIIAVSRIYLQVHFPSDVLAGLIFGVLTALLTVKVFDHVVKKRTAS